MWSKNARSVDLDGLLWWSKEPGGQKQFQKTGGERSNSHFIRAIETGWNARTIEKSHFCQSLQWEGLRACCPGPHEGPSTEGQETRTQWIHSGSIHSWQDIHIKHRIQTCCKYQQPLWKVDSIYMSTSELFPPLQLIVSNDVWSRKYNNWKVIRKN